ncbi:hypothetical protein K1719_004315 [Acacia pycnantha]|nr:hypothetical protein K1719_004315 [Acacia pycnantha]
MLGVLRDGYGYKSFSSPNFRCSRPPGSSFIRPCARSQPPSRKRTDEIEVSLKNFELQHHRRQLLVQLFNTVNFAFLESWHGALIGYTFLFNFLYTLSLQYLNRNEESRSF